MSENYYFTSQLMSSEFNAENLNFKIKFQKKLTKINLISFCIGPFNILEKKNLPLWISFLLEKATFGNGKNGIRMKMTIKLFSLTNVWNIS